jgi:hypothetical protein
LQNAGKISKPSSHVKEILGQELNIGLIILDESCRLQAMERDEIVRYWLESSDDDYQVMQSLFDNGHYAWALFLSHLVI